MERFWVAVAAWIGIIVIHEYGHVLAGVLVGVPRREMRVSLRGLPHVALRTSSGWVAPGSLEYVATFRRHVSTLRGAFAYVAGGFVQQTAAVVVFAVAVRDWPAQVAAQVSLAMILAYIVLEAVLLRVRGHPFGDVSALWRISPAWSGAFFAVLLALHLLAFAITD